MKDPGSIVMEALMKNDVMAALCCPLAQVRGGGMAVESSMHACTSLSSSMRLHALRHAHALLRASPSIPPPLSFLEEMQSSFVTHGLLRE